PVTAPSPPALAAVRFPADCVRGLACADARGQRKRKCSKPAVATGGLFDLMVFGRGNLRTPVRVRSPRGIPFGVAHASGPPLRLPVRCRSAHRTRHRAAAEEGPLCGPYRADGTASARLAAAGHAPAARLRDPIGG